LTALLLGETAVSGSVGFFSVQLKNAANLQTGRALVKRRKRKKTMMRSTQRMSRVMKRIRLR
jgi:hypothetical protein